MQDTENACRRCGGSETVRAGFVNELQRYKCKGCGYHFTRNAKGVPAELKRLAIHLYLEGMGFRAIARIIGVSDVAVAKWINPIRKNLIPLRKSKVIVNEIHKLEHFFITKEIFNKYGWLLIGIEENKDVSLLGSYTIGNCRLEES